MELRVGGRAGALVRAGVEKTTAIVGTLARDTAVTTSGAAGVAADGTRRAEVVAPLRGWVSASSLVAAAPRAAALEPSPAEYDELFAGCGRRDSFCGFAALEAALAPTLAGSLRILDCGCGTSGVVAALVAAGHDARGVDVSAAAVALQRETDAARFAVADARALDGAAVAALFGGGARVDVVFDKGTSDALFGYRESRRAVDKYLAAVRSVLAPAGRLVVVSTARVGGVFADDAPEGVRAGNGAPCLAAVAAARGWAVERSALVDAGGRDYDVVVYAAAGDVPPPPEASPRFGDDELCPPWVDDDDDDDGDGLPTWVEGDSLAPYLGTPAAFLDGALGLAGIGPGDVVCDVGCGDGRLATFAVAKFGAARGYGLELEPHLVGAADAEARRRGVGHRTAFFRCDVTEPPSPDVAAALAETTLLAMYLLPEALDRVLPLILAHLRRGRRLLCLGWAPKDLAPARSAALAFPNGGGMDVVLLDGTSLGGAA